MYICMCVNTFIYIHIYIHITTSVPIYLKTHEFIPLHLIPIQYFRFLSSPPLSNSAHFFSDSKKHGSHYSQQIYLFGQLTYLLNVTNLPNMPATSSVCAASAPSHPHFHCHRPLHVVHSAPTAILPQM